MLDKLNDFKNVWIDYGFELCVGLSLLVILILAIFRFGKKGSWSSTYTYNMPGKLGKLDKLKSESNFGPRVSKDSSGETECRKVLSDIFKRPFSKARPDFLRNPVTGNKFNLEIDCFDRELGLGCEYNGIQHYKYSPFFHGNNKEKFMNQKYRDDMKRRMCRDNGITLIEVPYTVKVKDIRGFLIDKLKTSGYIK